MVSGMFVQCPISTSKDGLFCFSKLSEFVSEPWLVIVEGAEGICWYAHVVTENERNDKKMTKTKTLLGARH